MKLIIDIPELFYNNSKKRVSSGIDLPIDKYVANGIPYEERPQGDIRWTDKLSVKSNGDIIDFEGRVLGHIDLEDMRGGAE